ncbi:MAG: hypothetical protein KKE44_05070 [Proteobacteria bacterium]|nr:hypothetical protein [Pseudomonadota bacterium]MBU1582105.1 hypothetical protein [Pseudomonadota bacterium]MBU2631635.1 hypothetical protein [Pseudomonadota bacterium]
MMKPVNVFLTVDTEHSIGGAFENPKLTPVGNLKRIYGKIDGHCYGIPLIMDIADRSGLRVVFFLEVMNKYFFGEDESKQVCQYILKRNHEVQLHVHPNYLNFTGKDPGKLIYSDFISAYSPDRQVELLQEARDLLIKYGSTAPTAFRAGCFGADLNTLKALKKNGFLIDSSYNRAYCNITCSIPESDMNDVTGMEGIFEFPVTNFIENSHIRSRRFMPMDINGVSFQEMKQVLEHAAENGPKNITIILHSFSFLKSYDVQYTKAKPRKTAIKRFKKLCRFLAENQDRFNVMTFDGLNESDLDCLAKSPKHSFLTMPSFYSILRGFEQLQDNFN